ncbi:hypothetical protein ACQJBY_003163 [Aegilops geniculata]
MVQRCFQLVNGARLIHSCDEVHFPTLHSKHWFDFVVLFKHEMFVILDSAFDADSDFHQHVLNILFYDLPLVSVYFLQIPNFKRVWNMYGSSRNLNWRNWTTHFIDVPKQSNEPDCGIYTALFLKHWKPRVLMHDIVKDEDIANIRIRMANEMMFTDHNILNDHKKLVLEF